MAGGLWLLCIVTSVASFIAASPLIVANDAAATAANILASISGMFLPRTLGILLAIGGTSYVISSFANFLTPSFGPHLMAFILPVALIGEGSLTVWLLVKGVNVQRWNEQASLRR
jgi:hypothetical protein